MDVFKLAHAFVAGWEGGLVDDPADSGGITNHGASLKWMQAIGADINGDGGVDRRDVLALTPEGARALFKKHFWDALRLDELPPLAAIALYDGAVNQPIKVAVQQMQAACNMLCLTDILACDGVLGPKTRERIAEVSKKYPGRLVSLAIQKRIARYELLAEKNPKNKRFLKGWLNRATALRDYLTRCDA